MATAGKMCPPVPPPLMINRYGCVCFNVLFMNFMLSNYIVDYFVELWTSFVYRSQFTGYATSVTKFLLPCLSFDVTLLVSSCSPRLTLSMIPMDNPVNTIDVPPMDIKGNG